MPVYYNTDNENILWEDSAVASFGINVFDFGAKGDGVTDDTAAIQAAIDHAAARGGGKILFPYTKGGYRIASPGIEKVDGKPVRAQLVIPAEFGINIQLEGEMPCRLLNEYQVRPLDAGKKNFAPTRFGTMPNDNTLLFSDWDAPEEHDPTARPWAILAAPEGNICKGHFSVGQFSIKNLEFRVPMDIGRMYPTQTAVNLQNCARVCVESSQFCIGEQVGDALLEKELQPNPCHTAGLVLSDDQSDHNVLRSVAVQGFRYGIVAGEQLVADYLYIHNCEEGITFHDCSHLSVIDHMVAQHNTIILSTTQTALFGMPQGPCNVRIGTVDLESGHERHPVVSQLQYGVYDPEHRLHGTLQWHKSRGRPIFPTLCAEDFKVTRF